MGDVMQESAKTALSYVRSITTGDGSKTAKKGAAKIPADYFAKHDFHIHIPEGAVPKDGPSAGITMATGIYSAVTKQKVRSDLAMTGGITLRGNVLPIGGLKEKLLAANIAGIKTVLVPDKNRKDVDEIEEEIIKDLDIIFVENMDQVLKEALV